MALPNWAIEKLNDKRTTELDLIDHGISVVGAIALADALKNKSTLTKLDLSYNPNIQDDGATALANALKENSTLTELSLDETRIGDDGAKALADALKENSALIILKLRYNEIGVDGAIAFADALKENSTLTVLNLRSSAIRDDGAKVLADVLKENSALIELNLDENGISVVGAKALANALKENSTLTKLQLRCNSFGDVGATALVDALKENSALITLRLSMTAIQNETANVLADVLKENSTLAEVNLGHNSIGVYGAECLGDALKENSSLTKLTLSYNPNIQDDGARALANALKENSTLTELNLVLIGMGDDGATALADALKENSTVTTLRLRMNDRFRNEGIRAEIEASILQNIKAKNRKFFDALNSQEKDSLNRSRLMFIGQGAAGKSSTIRSLLGKRFNPHWDSTVGATISEGMTNSKASWKNPNSFRGDYTSRFVARMLVNNKHGANFEDKKSINVDLPANESNGDNPSTGIKTSVVNTETINSIASNSDQRPLKAKHSKPKLKQENIVREYDETLICEAKQNADTLTLSLWDFGGQEVFYAMHHLFLTQTGVYILVFDMRELIRGEKHNHALKTILFWLRSIQLHAPEAPLILAGTFLADMKSKTDIALIDKTLNELVKTVFSQIVLNTDENLIFFPIDNMAYLGIESLRQAVENMAKKDNEMCPSVPIKWMAFLDKIYSKRDSDSYLQLSNDIREFGNKVGIVKISEQQEALSLFHERGLVIHLTSTEILSNIVILKPQWLVDVIGKVICDKSIHVDEEKWKHVGLEHDFKKAYDSGVVSRDFLEYAWEGEPIEFLLDLMERAMLLSSLSENLYLIPSLLQNQFEVNENSKLGYRFILDYSNNFLPTGVFQRLVCLCVAQNRNATTVNEAPLMIFKNFISVEIQTNQYMRLIEHEDSHTIDVYLDHGDSDNAVASRCFRMVHSIMQKINHDVMNSRLRWETYFEKYADNSKTLVELKEAQAQSLAPWFCSKSDINVYNGVELSQFLDAL